MDEYLGDKTSFWLIDKADAEAQDLKYKNAPISTKRRITSYLELADKHPPFVQFRKMINDEMMKAIDSHLNSWFSELT